jgi:Flp pilus assembly protein TadG
MKLIKHTGGATAVEFALVFPVFIAFILGMMHVAYVLWIDNVVHYAVDASARCGAIYVSGISTPSYPCSCPSGTTPCTSTRAAMIQATATTILGKAVASVPSATFQTNPSCPGSSSGLTASYAAGFLVSPTETTFLKFLKTTVSVNAKSCYPNFA